MRGRPDPVCVSGSKVCGRTEIRTRPRTGSVDFAVDGVRALRERECHVRASAHPHPAPPDAGESTGAAVVRGHDARQALRRRHVGRRRAARRRRRVRRGARSPRSWARRARASRRCCTSSPGSTGRPSGWVEIDGTRLDRLNDRDLTLLRRRSVGFVFQSLQPAPGPDRRGEHHPAAAHRRDAPPTASGSRRSSTRSGSAIAARTARPRCPAASSSASPWRARSITRPGRRVRRRADRQPRLGLQPRDPRAAAPRRRRLRPDHRHGHPRPVGGDDRRSRPLPRRRRIVGHAGAPDDRRRSSTTCKTPERMIAVALRSMAPAQAALGADRHGGPARRRDDRRDLRPDRSDPDGVRRHHADRQRRRRRRDVPAQRRSPAPSAPTSRSTSALSCARRARARRRRRRRASSSRRGSLVVDGKAVEPNFAPAIVVIGDAGEPFNPLRLVAGRAARGSAARSLVNRKLAEDEHLSIGQRVGVDDPHRHQARRGSSASPTTATWPRSAARRSSSPRWPTSSAGTASRARSRAIVASAAPGVTPSELVRAPARGAAAQPRDQDRGADRRRRRRSRSTTASARFLTPALLAFSGAALLVGAFIIFNTFSITVAQRTREFALLRSLGATRAPGAGRGRRRGAGARRRRVGRWACSAASASRKRPRRALRRGRDGHPAAAHGARPADDRHRLVVGIGVTLARRAAPGRARDARAAGRGHARRGAAEPPPRRRRRRAVAAVVGARRRRAPRPGPVRRRTGRQPARAMGARLAARLRRRRAERPLRRAARWPASSAGRCERLAHTTGELARENATRNPARTAVTAAALMVGLALVVFVAVFAAGMKTSIDGAIDRARQAPTSSSPATTRRRSGAPPGPHRSACRGVDGQRAAVPRPGPGQRRRRRTRSTDQVNGVDPLDAARRLPLPVAARRRRRRCSASAARRGHRRGAVRQGSTASRSASASVVTGPTGHTATLTRDRRVPRPAAPAGRDGRRRAVPGALVAARPAVVLRDPGRRGSRRERRLSGTCKAALAELPGGQGPHPRASTATASAASSTRSSTCSTRCWP